MPDVKSKPLFKKPKNKKKRILKKRKLDDDDDAAAADNTQPLHTSTTNGSNPSSDQGVTNDTMGTTEENELDTLTRIQQMKKVRKIKNQFRAKRPSKAKHATHADSSAAEKEEEEQQLLVEANQDLKQRLEGNFAVNGASTTDGDGNVLTLKHKLAMEQFISSKMQESGGDITSSDTQPKDLNENPTIGSRDITNTTELYAHILQETTQLSNIKNETKAGEEDVGAGGSMLGGTGIAEIVLPVEDRIQTAKETELAAMKLEKARNRNQTREILTGESSHSHIETDISQALPTNFGSGPGKRKSPEVMVASTLQNERSRSSAPLPAQSRVLNKDILTDIGSSYTHNFRLHNDEWITNKKKMEQESRADTRISEEADDSRVGFEASRGIKSEGQIHGHGGGRLKRANDDRVYKTFVKREFKNNRR